MDKLVKQRIYASNYWKTKCFNINEASLCDRAVALECVGGLDSMNRPTEFLCLLQKLLLLEPEREIILEYLSQPYLKYLTALAAFYVRMSYSSEDVHALLEPLLDDWRKLRFKRSEMELTYMDEFVDSLLQEKRLWGIQLPRLREV